MTTMIIFERFQAHDELGTCRTQHLRRRVTALLFGLANGTNDIQQ